MMERGPHFLHWVPGDHTRLAGKMQFHYRLAFDGEGRPMFQVFSTCRHFIRTLPNLVYDESNVEDIDTRQEDHIYDECRYVLMENPISRPGRPCSLRWGMTRWSCTGGRDFTGIGGSPSPSALARCHLSRRRGLGSYCKVCSFVRSSHFGSNDDDRRQRRKQEELLGQRPARMRTE